MATLTRYIAMQYTERLHLINNQVQSFSLRTERHCEEYIIERLYVGGNKMSFENIRPEDIFRQRGNGSSMLIDLRNREEYDKAHIPGAICIPYEELYKNLDYLRRWAMQCQKRFGRSSLILYCNHGNNSLRAARDLNNMHFQVKSVFGGISAYKGPKVKTQRRNTNYVDGT